MLFPVYSVTIGGRDVSSLIDPILKTITVTDNEGVKDDSCEILLADLYGRVALPGKDDPVTVMMGHMPIGIGLVFTGFVDRCTSTGTLSGGTELAISAKSDRSKGKSKQPRQKHADKKNFGAVAQEWAGLAGLSAHVDGELASVNRDYWSLDNESFRHWGLRISRELGAVFKIVGDKAMFVKRGSGLSVSGLALGGVTAARGSNLLAWSIQPDIGQPQFTDTESRWYDPDEAKWKREKSQVPNADSKAKLTARYQSADKNQAKKRTESDATASDHNKASGSIRIIGNPYAKAGAPVTLVGARGGIDGGYKMTTVKHEMDKKKGYISDISVGKPSGKGSGSG